VEDERILSNAKEKIAGLRAALKGAV